MKLQDKTFLISGGASGLGAATARTLVEAGANVLLADLNSEAGEALAAELDGQARLQKTDVTSEESVNAAIAAAVEAFGGLNGIVNCAGIAPGARIVGREGPMPLADFTPAIQVNLVGSFNLMRLVASGIAALEPVNDTGERGVIINTASVAAFDGQIGQAAYSASKGGILGLTLPVARDLAQYGIRVVSIQPGIFETPMFDSMPETVREALAAGVPFPQRLGRADEFADLVRYICRSDYINGEAIRLDGAIRLAPR